MPVNFKAKKDELYILAGVSTNFISRVENSSITVNDPGQDRIIDFYIESDINENIMIPITMLYGDGKKLFLNILSSKKQ